MFLILPVDTGKPDMLLFNPIPTFDVVDDDMGTEIEDGTAVKRDVEDPNEVGETDEGREYLSRD